MRHALRLSVTLLVLSFLALSLLMAGGCSSDTERGQLLLAIETDMAVPKDLDKVVVEVITSAGTKREERLLDGTKNATLPGTFAIVAGSAPDVGITIRVAGYQKGHARVLREVQTALPADGVRVVRVALQWLCANDGVTEDADGGATSSCPARQTCVAGECVGIPFTNPSTLPALEESRYAPNVNTTCFDPVACFAGTHEEKPSGSSCTFPQPEGVDVASGNVSFNVAVKVPAGSQDGFCANGSCLIPLDFDPTGTFGWYAALNRIRLPRNICDQALSVVWSRGCASKSSSSVACQGGGAPPETDGGTNDVDAAPAVSVDAEAGAPDVSVMPDVTVVPDVVVVPDARVSDALDATPDRSIDAPDDRAAPIDAGRDASDGGVDAAPDVPDVADGGVDAPGEATVVGDGGDAAADANDGSVAPDVDAADGGAPLPELDAAPDVALLLEAAPDLDGGVDADAPADAPDAGTVDASGDL